jgi:hypothetical protein
MLRHAFQPGRHEQNHEHISRIWHGGLLLSYAMLPLGYDQLLQCVMPCDAFAMHLDAKLSSRHLLCRLLQYLCALTSQVKCQAVRFRLI